MPTSIRLTDVRHERQHSNLLQQHALAAEIGALHDDCRQAGSKAEEDGSSQ